MALFQMHCNLLLVVYCMHIPAGLQGLHPIFSPKDFLEVLIRVRNPNFITGIEDVGEGEGEGLEVESQMDLCLL